MAGYTCRTGWDEQVPSLCRTDAGSGEFRLQAFGVCGIPSATGEGLHGKTWNEAGKICGDTERDREGRLGKSGASAGEAAKGAGEAED